MMSLLISSIIGLLILLFESSTLHALSLNGVMPNLTLMFIIFYAVLNGKEKGRRLGLILGLLQDLLFCPVLGFYGMLFFFLGHLSGFLTSDLTDTDLLIPLSLLGLSDLIYGLVSYLIFGFFQGNIHFFAFLLHRILPELIYTLILGIVLFPLLRLLFERLYLLDERLLQKRRRFL